MIIYEENEGRYYESSPIKLDLAGGKETWIALLQSESYVQEERHGSLSVKATGTIEFE